MTANSFLRLKQHEDQLDHCIRCGYCYEHCPIYKHTRWETDAPRGKLALCYGLLMGDLQPSDYIATKLYECFFCRRCESNCSAGVPVTEVFEAARQDLRELGYEPQGTTSGTDYGLCARCLNCIRMCPHEARFYDHDLERVITDRVKCQGCGNCLEVCPRLGIDGGATYGTGHDAQVAAVRCYLDALDDPSQPRAVVFNCNWSTWPGFQASVGPEGVATRAVGDANERGAPPAGAGSGAVASGAAASGGTASEQTASGGAAFRGAATQGYETLVNVCAGRLQSRTLLQVLRQGAWGVLVTACPADECDHGGNERARRRITALQQDLPALGVDPRRVQLVELAKGNQKGFDAAVRSFVSDLSELGPLL
jgi:coenzyme F420-reducing hydrogenase delta subunit/ferredoxin